MTTPIASPTILTLNARDSVMLRVAKQLFSIGNRQMRRELQAMHGAAVVALAKKGIPYSNLKGALVPSPDRNEAGFLFDSQAITSGSYGLEISKVLLPLLDRSTVQSVLCGDLLGESQETIFKILDEFMVLARSFTFAHGVTIYCVYLNNLSDLALARLHSQLSCHPSYLGYLPATFQTRAKTYLSTTLAHAFVKYGTVALMCHPADAPDSANENPVGYAFESVGYVARSVSSLHFDPFLSFKIERPVSPHLEFDTDMALNTTSEQIVSLRSMKVELTEAKFTYLHSDKLGKLRKAEIDQLDRPALTNLIHSKVCASYIYNLAFLQAHDVAKFNVIIEVPRRNAGYPTRFIAALEYLPERGVLRVITLT